MKDAIKKDLALFLMCQLFLNEIFTNRAHCKTIFKNIKLISEKIIYCKALLHQIIYFMKQAINTGFVDIAVSKRKIKQAFFQQINAIINWDVIATKLDNLSVKGLSHTGRPSYEGLLLFKITLLQTWYNMSNDGLEEAVKDRSSLDKEKWRVQIRL